MLRLLSISILVTFAVACVQTENSNSLDADTYSNVGGSPGFAAARTVLSQSCGGSCHSFHTLSEAELEAAGKIVAGDAESSQIYYRIAGSAGSLGPKNMPSGGALSVGDIEKIKTWIDGI